MAGYSDNLYPTLPYDGPSRASQPRARAPGPVLAGSRHAHAASSHVPEGRIDNAVYKFEGATPFQVVPQDNTPKHMYAPTHASSMKVALTAEVHGVVPITHPRDAGYSKPEQVHVPNVHYPYSDLILVVSSLVGLALMYEIATT